MAPVWALATAVVGLTRAATPRLGSCSPPCEAAAPTQVPTAVAAQPITLTTPGCSCCTSALKRLHLWAQLLGAAIGMLLLLLLLLLLGRLNGAGRSWHWWVWQRHLLRGQLLLRMLLLLRVLHWRLLLLLLLEEAQAGALRFGGRKFPAGRACCC